VNSRATVIILVVVIALTFAVCVFGQRGMDDASPAPGLAVNRVMIGA